MLQNFTDIRQSEIWAKYLESMGWRSYKTSRNINIEILHTKIGGMVKIQRPPVMSELDLIEIESICKKYKSLFIKIEVNENQDMEVFAKYGYVQSLFPLSPTSTVYIDLEKTTDELWANVHSGAKYKINRAKREGAKVLFYQNPPEDKLRLYYDEILKQTGMRKGFYVQPFADLMLRSKLSGDEFYLCMAYDSANNLCGGKIYMGYKDMVLYLHGGTTKAGLANNIGYLILWESFLYLKEKGYKILDLEGRDDKRYPTFTKNWEGFSHFKEKFGGVNIEFPVPQIKFLNPILKFLAKYTIVPL